MPTANTPVKIDSKQWSLDSNDRSSLQLIAANPFFPFAFDVCQSTGPVNIWPETDDLSLFQDQEIK